MGRKIDITNDFVRIRQESPRKFDPKSFRTIDPGRPGGTQLVVACPKGEFKRGRCRVGLETQSVILRKEDFTKKELRSEIRKFRM